MAGSRHHGSRTHRRDEAGSNRHGSCSGNAVRDHCSSLIHKLEEPVNVPTPAGYDCAEAPARDAIRSPAPAVGVDPSAHACFGDWRPSDQRLSGNEDSSWPDVSPSGELPDRHGFYKSPVNGLVAQRTGTGQSWGNRAGCLALIPARQWVLDKQVIQYQYIVAKQFRQ